MKKYKTTKWSDVVTVVEVEKETDQSVWCRGCREAKSSLYHQYFDTFEEARKHLIERLEGQIKHARSAIHKAESALGAIRKINELF